MSRNGVKAATRRDPIAGLVGIIACPPHSARTTPTHHRSLNSVPAAQKMLMQRSCFFADEMAKNRPLSLFLAQFFWPTGEVHPSSRADGLPGLLPIRLEAGWQSEGRPRATPPRVAYGSVPQRGRADLRILPSSKKK